MGNSMNGSFVAMGAFAILGVACSSAPDATESTSDRLAQAGGGGSGIGVVSTPVAYPAEAFTAPDVSCDLYDYFPEAPGVAAGGWTTGTCPGTSTIIVTNTPPSFCSIDEGFANWQGPTVPILGSHCRGARAMHHQWVSTRGGGLFYELVPTVPSARGGHEVPGSSCTEHCIIGPDGNQECFTATPVYDYVICPWTPGANLDSWVASEASVGGNPEKLHVRGYCQPDSTTPTLQPTGGNTYAAIYEYDPKCTGCFPCN